MDHAACTEYAGWSHQSATYARGSEQILSHTHTGLIMVTILALSCSTLKPLEILCSMKQAGSDHIIQKPSQEHHDAYWIWQLFHSAAEFRLVKRC